MFLKDLNNFFSVTTIHGFSYINSSHSKLTRVLWLLILIGAFSVAWLFLSELISGYQTKYVSTTVETRSITEFPFPAVTFYSGRYNSKNAFLRKLLNQMEFTRYEGQGNSSLSNNTVFLDKFGWLVKPMHWSLFNDVEKYLLKDKRFLASQRWRYKTEICTLVSLALKGEGISLHKRMRNLFLENMHRYNSYHPLLQFLQKEVNPLIMTAKTEKNLTNEEISQNCDDQKNSEIKLLVETQYLAFNSLFIDKTKTRVGAGDLALAPYATGDICKEV